MPTIQPSRDMARPRASGRTAAFVVIAMFGLGGCSTTNDWTWSSPFESGDYATASVQAPSPATALAKWDGDISSPGMTAAHPTLPLGGWARVTNTNTAEAATVRITRRLAGGGDRSLELSRDAAAAVGAMDGGGVVVMIEPLDPRQTASGATRRGGSSCARLACCAAAPRRRV